MPRFASSQQTKVLLVMDVVESVRLMEENERETVARWQELVAHVVEAVLPLHSGRMVKSLGDGLMLEFARAQDCVGFAFAIQKFNTEANSGFPAARRMHLRIGAHVADFVTDGIDIYGTDVNLAARLTTLAGPGETVVSAELRDQLSPILDADIEDMGECYLKHIEMPVRVYRAGPPGHAPVVEPHGPNVNDMRPTIAVIPFEARSNEPEHFAIGELIADGVIAQLSRTTGLRVISRLSTTMFRGRHSALTELDTHLSATFVLSGSYVASGSKILIMAELANVQSNQIVWAERLSGEVGELLDAQSELLNRLAAATHRSLIDTEVQRALSIPLPRLDSGALLLGGISLMHRASLRDFDRSRQALEALVERHNKAAAPRAWLAKWYIMRILRGLSSAHETDTRLAIDQTKRALDVEPEHPLALAFEGLAYCQLLGDFALADQRLTKALRVNPNEPMAWLSKSVFSTMWGSAEDSIGEAGFAAALSPVDPLRYFFDMISASAFLASHKHEEAIACAKQSLRANRFHSPTLRVLLTAQAETGLLDDARQTLGLLLKEEPRLTLASYLAKGSSASITRQRCAAALRLLGVPEN